MIEIRHYLYFIAVAETGSFSKAAERCCITQGAISQQIKTMEECLGCTLFVRNARHLTLTEAGQELLPLARRVVCADNDCKDRLHSMKGCSGVLRIGVGSFVEPYIRKAAVRMMKEYPAVRLVFVYEKAEYLNRLLRNHEIDLAFSLNRALYTENIISVPSIRFYLRAIMPKDHPLAHKGMASFADVSKHSVVLPDAGERVFSTIQEYTKKPLPSMKVRAVVNDAFAALNLTENLQLMTFLPEDYLVARPNLTSKVIEELSMPLISNAHYLKDCCRKQTAEIFLKVLKEECEMSTLPTFN